MILRRYISSSGSNAQPAVPHLHSDGMPAAIFLTGTDISQVVLTAQFVGNARSCAVEIAKASHDFGTSAGVVGNLAQRVSVHALTRNPHTGTAAADRWQTLAASTGNGKGQWDWKP